jgi:HD-GYP domain-containing protein (c-di-GMP phosphodiesterase class II)
METSPASGGRTEKPADPNFFPIRVASLRVDTIADFDLFIQSHTSQVPVLYREKNLPFTEEDKRRLKENAVTQLYVSGHQAAQYRRYIETNLKSILADSEIPLQERSEVLYTSAMQVVKDVLAEPRAGEVLPRSKQMVENAVWFLFSQARAFENLLKVTSFDYYTYTHSVNVLVFSIGLARQMGYKEASVLDFGNGALLHDIGKCMIDPAILNFPGKLTSEQWEQIKLHPVYGYDILTGQGIRDGVLLDVTRHHHEKLTGKGYPDGLKRSEISIFVRISTIADIFDALTTRRIYKDALGSFDALKLMKAEMAAELDGGVFRSFVGMLGHPRAG